MENGKNIFPSINFLKISMKIIYKKINKFYIIDNLFFFKKLWAVKPLNLRSKAMRCASVSSILVS